MDDPVWALLAQAYAVHGVRPTLLERDFNFPPLAELYAEVGHIPRACTGGRAMSQHDQAAFAARIRNPLAEPLLPGVSGERMAVYEELFFNNLDGFITSGFPVLCRILGEPRRRRLVRAFLREQRSATPYFLLIGEAFVDWLQGGGGAEPGDPPLCR